MGLALDITRVGVLPSKHEEEKQGKGAGGVCKGGIILTFIVEETSEPAPDAYSKSLPYWCLKGHHAVGSLL